MELEQKQKQEYHHPHRPMYEAESAWDLDIDEKTSPGGTYSTYQVWNRIISYLSSLMLTSCEQA